jgi:DNA-binding transcriptional LysR family regulator
MSVSFSARWRIRRWRKNTWPTAAWCALRPRACCLRAWSSAAAWTLADLTKVPVVGLDVLDPVGRSLNQACREAGVGLEFHITVQTYHSALALAHHGLGVAVIDTCTAASADLSRVDVLELEPLIPVPIKALLPAGKPGSVASCGRLCAAFSRP